MRILRCWVLFPLLLCALLGPSRGQDVGDFVDTDPCYAALFDADTPPPDRKLEGDEYVKVIQALGPPGFLEEAETFEDLPRIIRGAFNLLACLCSVGPDDGDCCTGGNAHISNEGTGPGETPTPEQEVYLFSVCLTTTRAIEQTLGTVAPTPSPSGVPTVEASEDPTSAPVTEAPVTSAPVSDAPVSDAPVTPAPNTDAPVSDAPVVPTDAPVTEAPSAPTTPAPVTSAPSNLDFPVEAPYQVAFRDGEPGNYVNDLVGAMDILAGEVVAATWPDTRLRRRLSVAFRPPTSLNGVIGEQCPGFLNEDDTCQLILHSITLVVDDEENEEVRDLFLVELDRAIKDGRLQAILDEESPNSQVYIVTGLLVAPTAAPVVGGLSSGATVGIVIAACAGVLVIGGAIYIARRRQADKEDRENTYFPGEPTSAQALTSPDSVERDIVIAPEVGAAGATLGATQADYNIKGSKKRKSSKAYETLAGAAGVDDKRGGDAESSSNAGSSGWSSSAGVSSLNTGSVDSADNADGLAGGASLAALGAASAIAAAGGRKGVPDVPDVSRDDLDSAIEAGDWAAVGATAALLAAASDSQSMSSRSRKTEASGISRGGSSISSMDAARAAELDHLVDAGDWEGVVVAAAKFEQGEDALSGDSGGKTGGSSGRSQSTSLSESPSKAAKRDEIREEVENLVRRVVPEEIDNVDEMMMQFKGREEELVETLRTMQERQVAQKARVQGQKQAKREARATAALGGVGLPGKPSEDDSGINAAAAAGIGVGVAAVAGIAAAVGAASRGDDNNSSNSSSGSDSEGGESAFARAAAAAPILGAGSGRNSPMSSVDGDAYSTTKKRTALELAIEAGDWEAVGEAAAMMSDASINSASTGEINRFANMGDASSLASGQSSAADQRYKVNAERAAELDNMIDQGDWTGVVAAASRFSAVDHTSSHSPTAQDGTTATSSSSGLRAAGAAAAASAASVESGDTDQRKKQRLAEEQEALEQADIWMAIAQQSKTEGGATDAAASDAADWAIARSLSALKSAEAKGDLEQSNSSDGEASHESGRSV